jgi:hypothetical protein
MTDNISQENINIADALSEHDLQSEKFIKLVKKLKNSDITEHCRDLIKLSNVEISIYQIVALYYITVAKKTYILEKKQFDKSYYIELSDEVLKQFKVTFSFKLTWKKYFKAAYNTNYTKIKHVIDIYKFYVK